MRIKIDDLLSSALADHGPVSEDLFDVAYFSARKVQKKLSLAEEDWKRVKHVNYRFKGYPTSTKTIQVHIIAEFLDMPLGTQFREESGVVYGLPYTAFSGSAWTGKRSAIEELTEKILVEISRMLTEIEERLQGAREYIKTRKTPN
ncbi:hypothetical protein HYW59_02800 [Candidatus Kaiserbacteria bacterium]|nr:hypothetical protein [Candidatus Kaiserbacteria bacterium]